MVGDKNMIEKLQAENNKENELKPKDISKEFLEMPVMKFLEFCDDNRKEPLLEIILNWNDDMDSVSIPRRLKAFLESRNYKIGQKRMAIIRATKEQSKDLLKLGDGANAFSSGVKLEIIKKDDDKIN